MYAYYRRTEAYVLYTIVNAYFVFIYFRILYITQNSRLYKREIWWQFIKMYAPQMEVEVR